MLEVVAHEDTPASSAGPTSAQLCAAAYACDRDGDMQRALAAYIAAADQCLGMIWWSLMTSGHAADVHAISAMRKRLRDVL